VVVNLASAVPAAAHNATTVIEVIDADTTRRAAGRVRYKQYKDAGVEPKTHKLGDGAA
jgi:DNA polymerase IIIc chi subunit